MNINLLSSSDSQDRRSERINELLKEASSLEDFVDKLEKEETATDSWYSSLKKTHPSMILVVIGLFFFMIAFGCAFSIAIKGEKPAAPILASMLKCSIIIMLIFLTAAVVVIHFQVKRIKKTV